MKQKRILVTSDSVVANKEKVLVIGLGEIGKPFYNLIRKSGNFIVYGYDTKYSNCVLPAEHKVDYLHICIPFIKDYEKVVADYIKEYKPKLTVICSTVPPFTSKNISECTKTLVINSPVRGMHSTMDKDLLRYVKYIGPTSPKAGEVAQKYFKKLGFKFKVMGSAEETEIGKLLENCCFGAMIAIWQEMERICRTMGIDFVAATDLLRDTDKVRQDRPMFYPDVISGHCIVQSEEILLDAVNKHRPKPSTIVFLNAWRSNLLTKSNPPPKEILDKMKELFEKSRKSRKGES